MRDWLRRKEREMHLEREIPRTWNWKLPSSTRTDYPRWKPDSPRNVHLAM
jgi:hypothetical protein